MGKDPIFEDILAKIFTNWLKESKAHSQVMLYISRMINKKKVMPREISDTIAPEDKWEKNTEVAREKRHVSFKEQLKDWQLI